MATTSAPPTLDPKDVLGLDHLLGDEDIMLRDSVRRWVGDRVLPDIGDWFEEGILPRELAKEVGDLGLLGHAPRGLRLRRRERHRLRRRLPRARVRRLRAAQPRLRAGLAGDVPDLEVRLRGAEAAVAAAAWRPAT